MQAGTAHLPLGHSLHSVPKLAHSSAYLQIGGAPVQLSLHSLSKQPKVAQLPSPQGEQVGGGAPQSELLMHFVEPQLVGPAWQTPSPLQKAV
jgi:hypothetical protein